MVPISILPICSQWFDLLSSGCFPTPVHTEWTRIGKFIFSHPPRFEESSSPSVHLSMLPCSPVRPPANPDTILARLSWRSPSVPRCNSRQPPPLPSVHFPRCRHHSTSSSASPPLLPSTICHHLCCILLSPCYPRSCISLLQL